jgi:hypothetical protein
MQVDFDFNLTPEQFITNGQSFTVEVAFDDVTISVVSYTKKEDDIYNLYIKGDYPRGSSVKISLSHPEMNFSIVEMWNMAQEHLSTYVPLFITQDYTVSLKKVAQDKAKNANLTKE